MNILIMGIGGRMGQHVVRIAKERGITVACGVDAMNPVKDVPCYADFSGIKEKVDMVIDFSHHSLAPSLIAYCVATNTPVVVCTTGHTEEEKDCILNAAEHIPVFYSANMSLGVALLCELAKKTAAAFPDADIEIVETHHNRKLDAPSGTALMIADAIRTVRDKARFVLGRNGQSKREKNDIGIHAIRMGNIVGTHEVIVGTDAQTITLKHEAHDRAMFAEGAIAAASFLEGKPAGLYTMQCMID